MPSWVKLHWSTVLPRQRDVCCNIQMGVNTPSNACSSASVGLAPRNGAKRENESLLPVVGSFRKNPLRELARGFDVIGSFIKINACKECSSWRDARHMSPDRVHRRSTSEVGGKFVSRSVHAAAVKVVAAAQLKKLGRPIGTVVP